MISILKRLLFVFIYILVVLLFSNIIQAESSYVLFFGNVIWLLIVLTVHLFFIPKLEDILLYLNRFNSLLEFEFNLLKRNIISTLIYTLMILGPNILVIFLKEYDLNLTHLLLNYIQLFLILYLLSLTYLIDYLKKMEYLYQLIFISYVLISFLVYPLLKNIPLLSMLNIASFNLELSSIFGLITHIIFLVFIFDFFLRVKLTKDI